MTFKDSGIEWLGEIPKHWEVVKIKHIAEIITGKTPALDSEWGNSILFVTPTDCDLDKKYISSSLRKLSQNGIQNFNSLVIPKNSILVTCIASIGKVAINLKEVVTNQQINAVIPDIELALTDFIFYQLLTTMPFAERYFCGYNTLPILNKSEFSNIKIPLPPIEEQKAIADFLDSKCKQIESFVDKKQRLITLLNEKKQALINECISKGLNKNVNFKDSGIEHLGAIPTHWEILKLKYVALTNIGLVYTPDDIVENSDKGYPLLRANNIQNGKIDYQDLIYIKSEQIEKKQIASIGDLLMCVRNGSENLLGKTAKIQDGYFSFGAFTAIIKSQFNDYFYWIFQTNMLRKSIASFSVSNGIGQISQEDIKNFIIPFPPLQEQKQITQFLDSEISKIDSIIGKIKKQIELIKEYKSVLINQAVCGRINL